MRSFALFLSATLVAVRLVCAAPFPESSVSTRVLASHGVRARSRQRLVISNDDDDLDLPRFDNSEYTPSATETLEEALKQDRPLPTSYLLSLRQSRNAKEISSRHTVSTDSVSAQAPEQDKKHSKSMEEVAMTTSQDHEGIHGPDLVALASAYPDLLVIVLMVAFIMMVVVIEMANWAAVKHGATCLKVCARVFFRRSTTSIRLEGEERRLYAETCIQGQPDEMVERI